MSQITTSHLIITMAMALALAGCGDKNDKAAFSADSGHPYDWTATHKASAKADLETCVECHGEDLQGGISKSDCTKCHPASLEAVSKHPVAWGNFAYARHKAYINTQKSAADPNGTESCANAACHGASLGGLGAAPSCTKCHVIINKKHPADWEAVKHTGHKDYLSTIANVSTSCKTSACHGTDGKGVFLSGPACDLCHSMK